VLVHHEVGVADEHLVAGIDRAIAELSKLQEAIREGRRERITELLDTARGKRASLVKYKIRKKELLS